MNHNLDFLILWCACAGAIIGAGVASYELVYWYSRRTDRLKKYDGPEEA
jgi:hypothetical protein